MGYYFVYSACVVVLDKPASSMFSFFDFFVSFFGKYRFVFTLLDKKAPKREFSFVLKVDDDDKYKIENCKPFVDAEIVQEVEQHLNATDDMANFALRMRKFQLFDINGLCSFTKHIPIIYYSCSHRCCCLV